MGLGAIQRECKVILRQLEMPEPFNLDALCRVVSRRRGRDLHLIAKPAPLGPCGLWVAFPDADYVIYESHTTQLRMATTVVLGSPWREQAFGWHADVSLWPVTFMVCFAAYLAFALVYLFRGLVALSSSATGQTLATGLRLLAAACLAFLCTLALQILAITMAAAGVRIPVRIEAEVEVALIMVAGAAIVTGASWLTLQRKKQDAAWWWQQYRVHRELYPLWHALLRVAPSLALEPDRGALRDRCRVRNLEMRVYRRVIEIRDARLVLRPRFDAAVADLTERDARAAGRSTPEVTAYQEARILEACLCSRGSDQLAARPWAVDGPDDGSIDSEVSWLLEVAKHFHPAAPEGRPAGSRTLPARAV